MARKSRKNLPQPEQAAVSVLLPELEEAKMPAAIYGRLSVEDEEKEESMETQIALVQDYINRSRELNYVDDRAEAAKYDGDSSPPYQEVEMLNFHDEESVVHTVLEDFYAVGTLADELTDGFHMEAHGYLDREEVNARLIAFARKLEQVLDKWETHAALIA